MQEFEMVEMLWSLLLNAGFFSQDDFLATSAVYMRRFDNLRRSQRII